MRWRRRHESGIYYCVPKSLQDDGVEGLAEEKSQDAKSVYDLSGRQIAQPKRGLYIRNGKKFIVK